MTDQTPTGDNSNQPVTPPETPAAPAVAATPPPVSATPPETPPVAPTAPLLAPLPDAYDLKVGDKPINPTLLAAITPALKEAGLTNDAAAKLVAAYAGSVEAQRKANQEADLAIIANDKVLGGANLARTQTLVNAALAQFTLPAERAAFEQMGIANNPTLVRMFHRIGAAMQEKPHTDAGPPVLPKPSRASKLYGGGDLKTSGPKPN